MVFFLYFVILGGWRLDTAPLLHLFKTDFFSSSTFADVQWTQRADEMFDTMPMQNQQCLHYAPLLLFNRSMATSYFNSISLSVPQCLRIKAVLPLLIVGLHLLERFTRRFAFISPAIFDFPIRGTIAPSLCFVAFRRIPIVYRWDVSLDSAHSC